MKTEHFGTETEDSAIALHLNSTLNVQRTLTQPLLMSQ